MKQWFPWIPERCPGEDSEITGWYLTPEQHLQEYIIGNLIAISLLVFGVYRQMQTALQQQTQQVNNIAHAQLTDDVASSPTEHSVARLSSTSSTSASVVPLRRHHQHEISRIDYCLAAVLLASLITVVCHKIGSGRLWFLLQPCHVMHAMLTVIVLSKPDSSLGTFLFNLYLHLSFSPFLGLVAADLTVYKQALELENWFVQHTLLLIVPVYYIATERFALVTGVNFFVLCFVIELVFHTFFLAPLSLYSGYNLNYMACPASPLEGFGRFYRPVMTLICIALSFFMRYIVVELLRLLLLRQARHTLRQKLTRSNQHKKQHSKTD